MAKMLQVEDQVVKTRLDNWFERHAHTGWWLAIIGMLNIALNLLDLWVSS